MCPVSKNPILLSCPQLSYKILNPAGVEKSADEKGAADAVMQATGLDADLFRLGHTKARTTHTPCRVMSRPDRIRCFYIFPDGLKISSVASMDDVNV